MPLHRRHFLASAGALGLVASRAVRAQPRRLRLGIIGTGMRGQVLLQELARRDDVDVVALCDIEPLMLGRALALLDKRGKPRPATFGEDGDPYAYRRLLEQRGLEGVIIATPWE